MSTMLDPRPHIEERATGSMPAAAGPGATRVPEPRAHEQLSPGGGDRVQTGTRALLVTFIVFTLLAVIALLVRAGHTDTLFAWTIRSLPNASFIGAAYAAGFVMSVLALRQRSWSQMRVAVVTVTAFTVLTLIPTVWHMHRLHLMADSVTARLAAQVWVVVYVLIPVACGVVVVRQDRRQPRQLRRRPMPSWLVTLLAVQGMALAAAGGVLFVGGAESHLMLEMQLPGWPWPVTPLTAQVIGAWLLSFGFAIAVAIRDRDLSRMFVPALAYVAFGAFELTIMVGNRAAAGTDLRWLWVDVAILASLIPTGAYGAVAAVRRRGF